MQLELNEQEVNLVLQALGEMPAKVTYMLIQNVGNQAAAYNRQQQEAKSAAMSMQSVSQMPDLPTPPSGQ